MNFFKKLKYFIVSKKYFLLFIFGFIIAERIFSGHTNTVPLIYDSYLKCSNNDCSPFLTQVFILILFLTGIIFLINQIKIKK